MKISYSIDNLPLRPNQTLAILQVQQKINKIVNYTARRASNGWEVGVLWKDEEKMLP